MADNQNRLHLKPEDYREDWDEFADDLVKDISHLLADKLQAYKGSMPLPVAHYAGISGIITAAGFQAKAMVDLYGMNPDPLLAVVEEQFREGMAGPEQMEQNQ